MPGPAGRLCRAVQLLTGLEVGLAQRLDVVGVLGGGQQVEHAVHLVALVRVDVVEPAGRQVWDTRQDLYGSMPEHDPRPGLGKAVVPPAKEH
ncbi:hypothetical protein GCM10023321_50550 [Pseudonocardia eucalypti]|uniref:Secreted protein n=1 Tax=Pseudonocardia eucalypti TaxID=648755 RepID=A0ABP9QKJ4_9PSEU